MTFNVLYLCLVAMWCAHVIANITNDGNELFGLGCQTQLKLTHIIIMITAVVPIVLSKPKLKRINKNKGNFSRALFRI